MKSKQLIIETKWQPAGVDPSKTYAGTRFASKKYKNTFLKFKEELKGEFGITVSSTSAWRDAYNQARIMYVNWSQLTKNLRRQNESDYSVLRRRRLYLTGLYKNKITVGKLADIFDKYWEQSHDSMDWISSTQLTAALDESEILLKRNPVSNHQAKTAIDIVNYGSFAQRIKSFVNNGKSKYAKWVLNEGNHLHVTLNINYTDNDEDTEDIADLKPKKTPVSSTPPVLAPPPVPADSAKETDIDIERPQTIDTLPVLRYGSRGPDVKNIQRELIDLYGPEILPKYADDGRFKHETKAAVKKFQRDHKLTPDGIVGKNTYRMLYKYLNTTTVLSPANSELAMEMISKHARFNKILKEELKRAQHIMFEYNEADTWDDNLGNMDDKDRARALLSVDDDLGPDLADEYMNTPWLEIPDAITNRIDLRPWMDKKSDRQSTMHIRSLIRGINSRVKEDANAAKFVKAYLGKTLANRIEELTSDQVKDLMTKLHDFQASLSDFVAPTPEEQEQSRNATATWMNQDRVDNPGFSRE